MTAVPDPPSFASLDDYGAKLGDAGFWAAYAREALDRHGLPQRPLESGFVGTYPTFLAGDVVVKLFGYFGGWAGDAATELAVHRLLLGQPAVPAPKLVGHGSLFPGVGSWPYLITERLPGLAWRELRPDGPDGEHLAHDLGAIVRVVHDLPVPGEPVLHRDWPRDHRAGCTQRHRAWKSLPDHLVDQIEDFLPAGLCPPVLIHADLTADHVFLDGGGLAGVIDWGDAMVTDPHYELAAVHLDLFRRDPDLLRAFLDGYGIPPTEGLAEHALALALLHRFDCFGEIGKDVPLASVRTLGELAQRPYGAA